MPQSRMSFLTIWAVLTPIPIEQLYCRIIEYAPMGNHDDKDFLLQMGKALVGAKGKCEFAEVLHRHLVPRLRCEGVFLLLYNQASGSFAPISPVLCHAGFVGFEIAQLPKAGTQLEAAVRAGTTLVCDDLAASRWKEGTLIPKTDRPMSVIVTPVMLRSGAEEEGEASHTIAVIVAMVWARSAFSEEDRVFLQRVADQFAPILQSVLASEERDVLMAINRRLVVGTVTLQNLIPTINDCLHQIIPHDIAALFKWRHGLKGPWLDPIHIEGLGLDSTSLPNTFSLNQLASADILKMNSPVLLPRHDCGPDSEPPLFQSVGIHSEILCSVMAGDEPYGLLVFGSQRRNAFSERDLLLAEQVGLQLSQVISNVLAYEHIQRLKDQLERENVYLREEIDTSMDIKGLTGKSPVFKKTLSVMQQVAPTESTVLLLGETGTGKELLARAIHNFSSRKSCTLVKVNCAALPYTLVESELFGREKGAYTGALSKQLGRFEVADGSTIFLDEIGELPLELQAKLLGVLQEGQFERLGSTTTLKVNVRVIAATNRDLAKAVREGKFREDLYYRLSVFPISVPPLRERREDIPALVWTFVKEFRETMGKTIECIPKQDMETLQRYPWPGNIRELRNVIERAMILSKDPTLHLDLPKVSDSTSSLIVTLEEAERSHILAVLDRTGWRIRGQDGTAKLLGLKPSTLESKILKLGITRRHSSPDISGIP